MRRFLVALILVGCSEDGETALDAPDSASDVAEAGGSDGQTDGGQPADASTDGAGGSGGQADASPGSCELLPDGTCKGPAVCSTEDGMEHWCSGSRGYRYDTERKCLIGPEPVTVACTCSNAGFYDVPCLVRRSGSAVEVYWTEGELVTQEAYFSTPDIEPCGDEWNEIYDHLDWCSDGVDAG